MFTFIIVNVVTTIRFLITTTIHPHFTDELVSRDCSVHKALNDFRHVKLKYFTHPVSVYPTVQFALSETCIHLSL